MATHISETEAAGSFPKVMELARDRGESFVLERGGEPICELLPAKPAKFTGADLASLLRALPRPDDDYLAAVEELATKQPLMAESPWQP
jgi:hypothetical protein